MKKTKIILRAFSSTFEVTVMWWNYLQVEDAVFYLKHEFIDTAIIDHVVQLWPEGELAIYVYSDRKPTSFMSGMNGGWHIENGLVQMIRASDKALAR